MDTILILSPCWAFSAPPLGLASLKAFLRDRGFSTLVLDLNIDMFYRCKDEYKKFWAEIDPEFWYSESLIEEFLLNNHELIDEYLNRICESEAKVIGFSIYCTSMFFSLSLARRIKERSPEKLIVFGGTHCSRYNARNFIISRQGVDIVVEGEGEETLCEILRLIKKDGKVEFCPGTLLKKGDAIIDCGDRPLIEDLNSLPFPDFSDFPKPDYLRKDSLPASTSRGCVNRCAFCIEWPYWKRYRYKTGDYLFQEIEYQLSRYPRLKNIEFCDSLLNGNLKEISTFCDLIIKEKLLIHWNGQVIINKMMDFELLSKFKEAGCECLAYGLESASQRVIDKIKKGFQIPDAERIIRQTYEAGIEVIVNFMIGLPPENEDDFKETLAFISRNKEYITIVNPGLTYCNPGTYLYDHPEEFNISTPVDNGLYWRLTDNSNHYLVRLERFKRFGELVESLGLKSSYPYEALMNRDKLIGNYYFENKMYPEAIKYYRLYMKLVKQDNMVAQRLESYSQFL